MARLSANPDPAAALGRLAELARTSLPPARPEPDLVKEATWARLRARQEVEAGRRHRGWFVLSFGTMGAVAALAVMFFVGDRSFGPADRPLTFAVSNVSGAGTGSPGQEVRAPANAEAAIRFSDGTAVTLGKASRGRVAAASSRGARVRLDHGRARVKVVPRRNGDWTFDAGPCVIQVTGTTFDMNWSENDQQLEVLLYTGSVTVKGPPAPRGITLRDGQRLVMDMRENVARVERLAPAPGISPLPTPAAPTTSPADERTAPGERPATSARPTARNAPVSRAQRPSGSWPAMVASGQFAAVLGEARRVGLDEALGSGSAADLMALADAARFTGQSGLARRAFLTVRNRYPDSPAFHKAAFHLGRMAEDSDGDLARAIEWYGLYLASAPRGPNADDALGRKMNATLRLYGRASAKPLATDYLRRFPQGGYAEAARALLKE